MIFVRFFFDFSVILVSFLWFLWFSCDFSVIFSKSLRTFFEWYAPRWRVFKSMRDTISTVEDIRYCGGYIQSAGGFLLQYWLPRNYRWFPSTIGIISLSAEHPPMHWWYPQTVLHRRSNDSCIYKKMSKTLSALLHWHRTFTYLICNFFLNDLHWAWFNLTSWKSLFHRNTILRKDWHWGYETC